MPSEALTVWQVSAHARVQLRTTAGGANPFQRHRHHDPAPAGENPPEYVNRSRFATEDRLTSAYGALLRTPAARGARLPDKTSSETYSAF